METIASKEAQALSKIITDLELPLSKRMELTEAIKQFAMRERQEGFVDGLKEVVGMLEKRRGEPNGQQEV